MPGAIGAMVLPSLLQGTTLMTALKGAGPLIAAGLGGGLGNALAGGDFWKGTLGGLAGGALNMAMPQMTTALQGSLGDYAGIGANALRGGITSGVMGGNPLMGAALGGVMGTQPMQQYAQQATNALRNMAGLPVGGAPGMAAANAGGGATPGGAPQTPPLGGGGGGGTFMDKLLNPAALALGGMNMLGTMYQAEAQEDMLDKQMKLAREMDTGLGLRQQAAGYAMDPNSIPGSPGYQAALNERRRALNRLAAQRGMLNSGQLPGQLADAADEQLGAWYQNYANTANRAGGVPYPNYQNTLRSM